MKKFLVIGLVFILASCHKDEEVVILPPTPQFQNIEGQYEGVFIRDTTISNVTLELTSDTFSGSSSIEKFPAIGNGSYELFTNDSISFKDSTYWTADFDWTLILNNNWYFTFSNDSLSLKNNIGDQYILVKQ